ncbi:hypothetical protein [Lysinibacillus xylanilyticus]|uniref:hypothetical protein n=1 Tax=Lysinibacillus xylanilyticus TaxID=582475 RepID=UPI003CFD3D97
MTLNIEISDNYRITSDSTQIIVQRKHFVDPTLSPAYDADKHSSETREEWRNWKYCGKVTQAIEVIARQNVLESDATSLEQLRNEIALFKQEIKRAMDEDA